MLSTQNMFISLINLCSDNNKNTTKNYFFSQVVCTPQVEYILNLEFFYTKSSKSRNHFTLSAFITLIFTLSHILSIFFILMLSYIFSS